MGKNLQGKKLDKGITQRADGRFHVRVKGIPPAYRNTYQEATNYLEDQKYRLRNHLPLLSGKATGKHTTEVEQNVDEFFCDWLNNALACGKISQTTYINHLSAYNVGIKPLIGSKRLADVTDMDCRKVIDRKQQTVNKKGKPYKRSTIKKMYSLMKQMFADAVNMHKIAISPVPDIRLNERDIDKEADRKLTLSDSEAEKLFHELEYSQYLPLILLAYETGMRPGELLALRYKDIDLEKKYIYVRQSIQRVGKDWRVKPPKTRQSNRTIPMTERCKKAFVQIMQMKSFYPRPAKPEFDCSKECLCQGWYRANHDVHIPTQLYNTMVSGRHTTTRSTNISRSCVRQWGNVFILYAYIPRGTDRMDGKT